MNDFNNRIDAQRNILQMVNTHNWGAEELSGLSSKAIERWMLVNQIDSCSRLAELVQAAGRALFFLANKSQEQVTGEYEDNSKKVSDLIVKIAKEMQCFY
jgi:hypothetical protein